MSSGMNGTKSRGVFASVAEMQAADLRVGTTVWVHGGSRYDIYATDQGGSVQLSNGLWAASVLDYKGEWTPETVVETGGIYGYQGSEWRSLTGVSGVAPSSADKENWRVTTTTTPYIFRSVNAMKNSTELREADLVRTPGTFWEVSTDNSGEPLSNGLYAKEVGVLVANDYGLISGGEDNTSILDGAPLNGKSSIITSGEYHINKAFALVTENSEIKGVGSVELIKSVDGASAYLTWQGNTVYENITARSTLPSVPQIRTVVRSGAIMRKCNVFDNKHDSPAPDAWGFYFKDCDGATLYDCGASGNTQSDFTIVDNVKNVCIINGTDGGHGSGCKLNIEPNDASLGGVESTKIIGGSYDIVTVIEPFTTGQAINGVTFDSCYIDEFYYQGGKINVRDCHINTLIGLDATLGSGAVGRAGPISSNSILLGDNLIDEPSMSDISRDDINSYWTVSSSIAPTNRYIRIDSEAGVFTRLNPSEVMGSLTIQNRNPISAGAGDKFALIITCRKKQNILQPGVVNIQFLDGVGSVFQTNNVWFNKSEVIGETDITTETLFFVCPQDTTSLRIVLGSTSGQYNNSLDLYGVGLFRQYSTGVRGASLDDRKSEVIAANMKVKKQNHFPQATAGFYYPNSFLGERIVNPTPSAGDPIEWRCVVSGTPGTWGALTLNLGGTTITEK